MFPVLDRFDQAVKELMSEEKWISEDSVDFLRRSTIILNGAVVHVNVRRRTKNSICKFISSTCKFEQRFTQNQFFRSELRFLGSDLTLLA